MNSTSQSNRSDLTDRIENHFVTFVTRGQMRPEYFNAGVVLATTFVMVAIVSIVIQRLKSQKRTNRSTVYERRIKTLNSSIDNEKIETPSNPTNFNVPPSPKNAASMRYEKRLRSFHSAANKCYIEKYAKYCIDVINYCPFWINVKLGSAGVTPFHRVCFHGHVPLIELMLSKGADPHLTSDAGESAICLAIYYYLNRPKQITEKYVPCLEILRRAGCKFSPRHISYDTLLKLAIKTDKKVLTEWLLTNRQTQNLNRLERYKSYPFC